MSIRSLRGFTLLPILFLLLGAAWGEGTRTWEQSKFDELIKGTTHGVAIRSQGGLELAPAFKALNTTPSTYIWAIASDSAGNVYAAAGSPARVYRVTPDGKSTTIFEAQELQVQALVAGNHGELYAATAPDGKVYRIEPKAAKADGSWNSSVFFDPKTKYIWALLLDGNGNLYVATGDQGEIFRVNSRGEGARFFKSDEVHIRALALDPSGNLVAGSDGSGLIYRITPKGEGFVLYSAPKKEITALAVDHAGNIYAAGVGEKRGGGSPGLNIPAPQPNPATPGGLGITIIGGPGPIPGQGMLSFPLPGVGASGGSDIYRITPDGAPSRYWSAHEDIIYALAFDPQGRLLAGTGNRGHIFTITGQDQYTDLLKASASQVTAFAAAPNGGLYAATSNLGKLFVLAAAPDAEGTYESDVFDARNFSRWGRAEFRGAGNVEIFARSGNVDNPDRNWSPWTRVELKDGATLGVPPARFAQWKAVLHAGNPAPRVQSMMLYYLPKNVAPVLEDVTVQVGFRYPQMLKSQGADANSTPGQPRFEVPAASIRDRGSVGVKWTARDDNDDQLSYSVYYRGDGESRWLLLREDVTEHYLSFDAGLLPDGGYQVKVVASDELSHSPGEALTAERESARFEVDNTPPQIQALAAAEDGDKLHITFRAVDGFSPIKRAEFSVDAGDWQLIEPVGQLSDSRTESYDFRAAGDPVPPSDGSARNLAAKGKADAAKGPIDHVVVVRVYDTFENMATARILVRGK